MTTQQVQHTTTEPGAIPYDVFLRNYIEFREQPRPWSYEEDIQFESVVAEYLSSFARHAIPWNEIQLEHFPERTVWELKWHLQKLWFDVGQILGAVIGSPNAPPKLSASGRKNDFPDYSGMDLDAEGDMESNPSMRTIPKFPSCPQLPSHTPNKRVIPLRTPPASHPDLPSQNGLPPKDENLFFSQAYQASKLRWTPDASKTNLPAASLRKFIIADRKKKSLEAARQKARTKLTQKPTVSTPPGFW